GPAPAVSGPLRAGALATSLRTAAARPAARSAAPRPPARRRPPRPALRVRAAPGSRRGLDLGGVRLRRQRPDRLPARADHLPAEEEHLAADPLPRGAVDELPAHAVDPLRRGARALRPPGDRVRRPRLPDRAGDPVSGAAHRGMGVPHPRRGQGGQAAVLPLPDLLLLPHVPLTAARGPERPGPAAGSGGAGALRRGPPGRPPGRRRGPE